MSPLPGFMCRGAESQAEPCWDDGACHLDASFRVYFPLTDLVPDAGFMSGVDSLVPPTTARPYFMVTTGATIPSGWSPLTWEATVVLQ